MTAAGMIGPALFAFIAFVIIPAIAGLALSFFAWDLFGTPAFVGFANFSRLFSDAAMWQSLGVTALYVVLGVVPSILVGFLFAVLVNSQMRGIAGWRVLYLTPMVASAAVAGVIWANIFRPRGGMANQLLALVGIQGPSWLSDPFWALPSLVIMMIWGAIPFIVILYMAGLQRVPEDIYAAAAIDGAGKWRILWSMTWPSVRGTTLLVGVVQIVGFVGGSFELALIMTGGGPLGTTQSLALYAYKMAFDRFDIGYASALSLFQLVLLAGLVLLGRLATSAFKKGSA